MRPMDGTLPGATDARIEVTEEPGGRVLRLAGRLDAAAAARLWPAAMAAGARGPVAAIDLGVVEALDSPGALLLLEAAAAAAVRGARGEGAAGAGPRPHGNPAPPGLGAGPLFCLADGIALF